MGARMSGTQERSRTVDSMIKEAVQRYKGIYYQSFFDYDDLVDFEKNVEKARAAIDKYGEMSREDWRLIGEYKDVEERARAMEDYVDCGLIEQARAEITYPQLEDVLREEEEAYLALYGWACVGVTLIGVLLAHGLAERMLGVVPYSVSFGVVICLGFLGFLGFNKIRKSKRS